MPKLIRQIDTRWIEMSDGCKLAARLWLPEDTETDPVPAILEFNPYRRRDGTAISDASRHPYIAGHGYACVRVDIRGTGDSEGLVLDEYSETEQQDVCAVINWLAEQSWCNGKVGMWGISWGGFNSLQAATNHPPALKAIITLCASDDRYADDAHYLGGCLIEANLRWGTRFLSETARPPDPLVVGPGWRETWLNRLHSLTLFHEKWMQHQTRDDYWKYGSACESFENISAAVFAIGGWSDAYVNSVASTLSGLKSPRLGLIGPWGHDYPHVAMPAPAIGFLQEALRWWDYWLKGMDTGIMDEPLLRNWVLDSERPSTVREERPGYWTSNDSWPATNVDQYYYYLNADGLGLQAGTATTLSNRSLANTGTTAGEWNAWGSGIEFSDDQNADDAQCLVFDSPVLGEDLTLFGSPVVTLSLSVDQPRAFVALRLCDLWPDGAANRITFGLLNLTHLNGHQHPEPLEPGRVYRVDVRLRDIACTLPKGHRLRLAISTSYWPLVWPSPRLVTLSVNTSESMLSLPIRAGSDPTGSDSPFEPPVGSDIGQYRRLRAANTTRKVIQDSADSDTEVIIDRDAGRSWIADSRIIYDSQNRAEFKIDAEDPLSASHSERQEQVLERDDWKIRIVAQTSLSATEDEFVVGATVEAFENDERIFAKDWASRIPRNGI